MTRLGKYLATCSVSSRRKSEELIFKGLVRVNKQVIKDPAYQVNENDVVEYDSRVVNLPKKIVIALNKPPGYLSTCKDDFERKTIMDIVNLKGQRLYPAGRLDLESRGLIIITNDGELAYALTHPKFNIPKTYIVRLNRPVDKRDIEKIKSGIPLDNKKVLVKDIKKIKINICEISITEGRKRIIRRLFRHLGYTVIDLKRIKIGSFDLGYIKEGSFAYLKEKDVKELKKIIK
jgi:23S rRNA pseudouridine2605 synthase